MNYEFPQKPEKKPEEIGKFLKQYIEKTPATLDAGTEAAEKLVSGFMSVFAGKVDFSKEYRKIKLWTSYDNTQAETIYQQLEGLSVEKIEEFLLSNHGSTNICMLASNIRQLIEIIKRDALDNRVVDVIIVAKEIEIAVLTSLWLNQNPFDKSGSLVNWDRQSSVYLLDGKKDAGSIYG
jgi:hypothetical protein